MTEKRPRPHLHLMAKPAPAVRLVKPHERAHAHRRYMTRLDALYGRIRRAEEQFFWGCVIGAVVMWCVLMALN